MIVAAIYARKSTEQKVNDEAKSVTRQEEHAKAYAEKKGWVVAREHIYRDDGSSGAEFENRAGLVRLMHAVSQPRPDFQVLIVSEVSRLGREQSETGYVLKRLFKAGI